MIEKEKQKFIIQGLYRSALSSYIDAKEKSQKADDSCRVGAIKTASYDLGYYEGLCFAYGTLLKKSFMDFQNDVKKEEEDRCLIRSANS